MKRLGRTIALASELGMAMGLMSAGFVILGLLLGRWIDARLDTRPVASIISLLVGAVVGQVAIYRLATRSARRLSAQGDESASDKTPLALSLGTRVLVLLLLPSLLGLTLGVLLDALLGSGAFLTILLAVGGATLGLGLSVISVRQRDLS